LFLKTTKPQKSSGIFRHSEQQVLPHTTCSWPLDTRLLKKWEFQIISVMTPKLQDMTAESLSRARAQRINRNTAGTFLNALEKVAIENKFLTHRGIFTTMMNGIQINNEPDCNNRK